MDKPNIQVIDDLFLAFTAASPDIILLNDTQGNILYTNSASEKLLGYHQSELLQKPASTLIHPNDLAVFSRDIQMISPEYSPPAREIRLHKKDGSWLDVEVHGFFVSSRQGPFLGLIIRDITARKIQKLESVGILAGGVAHDFNNILTAILGNIDLCSLYLPEQNKAIPLLKQAEKACLHAKILTEQLLSFSNDGSSPKEIIQLRDIIRDCCNFSVSGSNVQCNFTLDKNMWQVKCNAAQINQAIQNLILNARQAMPEGGTINVICDNVKQTDTTQLEAGDYLRITIQDHGSGIADKNLSKIFDPYFSTKDSSGNNGKGLGLAIVYSIISRHNGHIEVESKEGQGTTFTIFLPANNSDDFESDEKHASPASKTSKSKVLVMDDEEMVRRVMKILLEALGHETIMAKDGLQAVEIYRESQNQAQPVDLVIMDLTIPGGMGGKETAAQLLQLDPQAKLIVYSGDSTHPIMSNFKDYGFKAAVTKPFVLDTLELVINSSLA